MHKTPNLAFSPISPRNSILLFQSFFEFYFFCSFLFVFFWHSRIPFFSLSFPLNVRPWLEACFLFSFFLKLFFYATSCQVIQNYSRFFPPLSKLIAVTGAFLWGCDDRKHREPIQTHCRPVDQRLPCVRVGKRGDGVVVHLVWPGSRSPSAHARGGWPDSFSYEWVGSFATSEPLMSINTAGGHSWGVSSYECFLQEVVDKYWPSSGWSPLVTKGVPVGLPILLVTSDDLLPRRLRRRLHLKYDRHLSCSSLVF